MIAPTVWAVSLLIVVVTAVKSEPGNSRHQAILGIASAVLIATTLVGLWQAWAPWQIEVVNR